MERNVTVFNGTEIIEQYQDDYSWDNIRQERDEMLKQSDLWMLADRYSTLTDSQKTELTNYRQVLRVLPQTYYDEDDYNEETGLGSKGANDAADNFPTVPAWMD